MTHLHLFKCFPVTIATGNIFAPSPRQDLGALSDGKFFDTLKYVIFRTTTWDIFKEMEMRHPNYISSPVPYDGKFGPRMTMFFGMPHQLYFARDPSSEEQRAQDRLIALQKEVADKYRKKNRKPAGVAILAGTAHSGARNSVQNAAVEDKAEKIGSSFHREARLAAAKAGGYIKPFRDYHLLTSSQHIIYNGISANSRNVANTITVKYPEELSTLSKAANLIL